MRKYYQHRKDWFRRRIGKRIYRECLSCSCKSCQKNYVDILKSGFDGNQHADYLFLVHNEMGIKYFDKLVRSK